MEPKLPSPEYTPQNPSFQPEFGPQNPERKEDKEHSPERHERVGEMPPHAAPVSTPIPRTDPVIPAPTAPAPIATASPTDDLPLVANDDDLIEKEWVDKAKQIIAQTKDDPHKREQEVGKLQADYLRKRYGKELGAVQE